VFSDESLFLLGEALISHGNHLLEQKNSLQNCFFNSKKNSKFGKSFSLGTLKVAKRQRENAWLQNMKIKA